MAKAVNTFLKSKMNKDLDARLLPKGEYRDAYNIQISKSEGEGVGTVENVLGNYAVFDFEAITGVSNLYCIGHLEDDNSNTVFLFLTDNPDLNRPDLDYYPTGIGSNHFIFSCNPSSDNPVCLVKGAFLNFSQKNPIYGVNLLERLLFWTDNRNQPRKINIDLANPSGDFNSATYYTAEDQISVAKYNPYECIELYQKSYLSTSADDYETTMKDVSSKYFPNGGAGDFLSSVSNTVVRLTSFEGDIQINGSTIYDSGSTVGIVDTLTGQIALVSGANVDSATYDDTTDPNNPFWEIEITGGVFPTLSAGQEVILNPNPYYNPDFSGDPDYLEDKFVRFSYRYKFEDNEYSLFAPFTQIAFIPKQDGYFMYVEEPALNLQKIDNQSDAYRSTVVYFVENKVEDINLRIPLPFLNFELENNLKVKEVDILYKEAQQVAVKVVDTVSVNDISNSAGKITVNGNVTGLTQFAVDNIQGGVNIGDFITGFGITGRPIVTDFDPTDSNNPSSGGNITLDIAQTLSNDTILNVNDPNYFVYNYESKKPFKTLPEKDLTRVYDKIPVKAFSQEVAGNRVIYGNYQDKHTPPKALNYNVAISKKSDFDLKSTTAQVQGGPYIGATTITVKAGVTLPNIGDFITIVTGPGSIQENTQVVSITPNGSNYDIELTFAVDGLTSSTILFFEPGANTTQTTSSIEYPNSSLKQNRNYQIGVVLSDRYGRTSTVLLSNNKDVIRTFAQSYSGSTVYSPYSSSSQVPSEWPGDSIKILFNEAITSFKNTNTGTPGLYNGDATSVDYNPLGWYSWKIVVKQTEQEYYNVYLPGIMAAYPEDVTLEIGKTSHAILINDNINKIPRDLSEVGPQQKQFRSSVQLYGRVHNTSTVVSSTNIGESNEQYYSGKISDTVSTISTVNDLFEYSANEAPRPNYFPQFYSVESNPLVARISTESKIGQISTTNFNTVTADIAESATTDSFKLTSVAGDTTLIQSGDLVLSGNFPNTVEVVQFFPGVDRTPVGAQITSSTPTGGANSFDVNAAPSGGAGNGTIVEANGIPAGTVITNISGTAPNITLTVSNIVNVTNTTPITYTSAPVLEVNEPQTVALGQVITIVPDATPGIQYLAVYETKPVESLLDIFWETSSSGLIKDLNNAVINESSAGATLSDFNTSAFNEGLVSGASILSGTFSILDNFGLLVDFSDINVPLQLTRVTNSVEDITNLGYFSLVQTTGQNVFNIVTTTAYYNAIYFGEEDSSSPSNLTIFNLTFEGEVNNQPLTVTRTINLSNIAPQITSPNTGTTISTTNLEEVITTINCINGANNPNFASIFANGSCTITSQTNSQGQDVTDFNYFSILPEPTIVNNEARFSLVNSFSPQSIPVDRYDLTICVQDAGGQNDQDCINISIDFGAKVRNIKQYTYRRLFARRYTSGFPGTDEDRWYQSITVFEVYDNASSNVNGWYVYNGPWSDQTTVDTITGLDFSQNYGLDNFPNAFISSQSFSNNNIGPGIPRQRMFGPQQPPLLNTSGGSGFITINFQDVNLPPLEQNLVFAQTEADAIQLWNNTGEVFAYVSTLFPPIGPFFPGGSVWYGDYSLTPYGQRAAGQGAGWYQGSTLRNQEQVLEATFVIDENNYNLDSVSWQILV